MITLTSARRRAEEFDAALGGSSVRPEHVHLLEVVAALHAQAAEPVVPRQEFSAALRERLLTEAETLWATRPDTDPRVARLTLPTRTRSARERRLVVAASTLVLAGGGIGMAAASQGSLPGETLYPVKRGLEVAQTDLASGDADRGRTLLSQANNRLDETRALLDADPLTQADAPVLAASTVRTFAEQADEGSALLISSYESSGDEAEVQAVRTFTEQALAELAAMADDAPADVQADIEQAALSLQQIDLDAARVCAACQTTDAFTPSAFSPALDAARVLASLDGGATLSNDHPLISRALEQVTLRPRTDAGGTRSSDDASSATDGPTDGLTSTPETEVPDADEDGLLEGVVPKDLDASSDDLGGAVGGATDGLKDDVDKAGRTVKDTVDKTRDAVQDVTDPLMNPDLP